MRSQFCPRRAQILDLIDWYQRQLECLGVEIQFNHPVIDDVIELNVDRIITATGSLPAGTGFQKVLPHVERLPGCEHGVWLVEDVMGNAARLGEHIIVRE